MTSLIAIFKRLLPLVRNANNEDAYAGESLENMDNWHFCVTSADEPVFIVELSVNEGEFTPHDLPNLEVSKWSGQIKSADKEKEITGAQLICRSDNIELRHRFIHTVESLIHDIGNDVDILKLDNAINQLVDLFHNFLGRNAQTTALGLWGELFVIKTSNDVDKAISYWHRDPNDNFDFSCGAQKVEVKTTVQEEPLHNFTYSQANPPANTSALIASVRTREEVNGLSLKELWSQVLETCQKNESRVKLNTECHLTLASKLEEACEKRYCEFRAKGSIGFYDTDTIPKITGPLEPGLTQVKFSSNLNFTRPIKRTALRDSGDLHGCFFI